MSFVNRRCEKNTGHHYAGTGAGAGARGAGGAAESGRRTDNDALFGQKFATLICIKSESEQGGGWGGRMSKAGCLGELQWSAEQSHCANWHHNGPLIMAITQQSAGGVRSSPPGLLNTLQQNYGLEICIEG